MLKKELVGTGRFELPTPRTPSECSTRLSHVPTIESRCKKKTGLQHSGEVLEIIAFKWAAIGVLTTQLKIIGDINL
jgi:hypothetical protein